MAYILSMDHQNRVCRLFYKESGDPVPVGEAVEIRDEPATVIGGRAPHKPGSSGRVYVRFVGEQFESSFFPHVIDMEWVPIDG